MENIKKEFIEIKKLISEKKQSDNTELSKSDLIKLEVYIKQLEREINK